MAKKSWFEVGPGATSKMDPPTEQQMRVVVSLKNEIGGKEIPLPTSKIAAMREIQRLQALAFQHRADMAWVGGSPRDDDYGGDFEAEYMDHPEDFPEL